MQDLVNLLNNADVLGKFSVSQRQRLVSLAVRHTLKRGEYLYWQGDLWSNVFFIAAGRMQSVIYSSDGRSFVVSAWEEGSDFLSAFASGSAVSAGTALSTVLR